MAKTPYEIRLELLNLAFSLLAEQRAYMRSGDDNVSAPTIDEVINVARKLNEFVSFEKNTKGE